MRFHSHDQESRERDALGLQPHILAAQEKQRSRDLHWLREALLCAERSKDPSTKVGVVIVRPDDNTLCSQGYNGFPKGMDDSEELYSDRELKLAKTIHAEMNAILEARERVKGYTLYSTHMTCERCAVHVIQAGIKRVICIAPSPDLLSRWKDALQRAIDFYKEAGVSVVWMQEESVVRR